jgi:zinc transport system permease protein
MQIAFVVGILLGIIIPLIGANLVFKRLSMTGDAISHTSLAGVAIGLLAGINPVLGAMLVSVVAALIVELIRNKFQKYSEISLSIVMSVGIGLTGLLSSFTPVANFDSYLFGSIVAITSTELIITLVLFAVVLAYNIIFYRDLMFTSYNQTSAKISGVNVTFINITHTMLSALTIALATKTIGALLVSSLIVLPVASSLQIGKSYKSTLIYAIGFSLVAIISGITISFYAGLKPGGTIVLIATALLAFSMMFNFIIKKRKSKSNIQSLSQENKINFKEKSNKARIKTIQK